MRALATTTIMVALALGASAAQAKNQKTQESGVQELKKGLDAMIASATQANPPPKTVDKDQGDDNASDRAIQVVCSKDTPAAQRSAICPVPVSP